MAERDVVVYSNVFDLTILELTKQLRFKLLRIIPDEGSTETKPEQVLLNALISYENKKAGRR